MLNAPETTTWVEAGLLLMLLAIAGFVTSWIATDVLHIHRRSYITVLTMVTAGLMVVIAWSLDLSVSSLVTHHWLAGLVGGLIAGMVIRVMVRKLPAASPPTGQDLQAAEAWEGVIYGVTEGVLLSGLPVFVAWQATVDRSWNDAASWGAALAASAVIIAVHHFGYWDFRGRRVLPAVGACLLLSVAYLATGSLIAPALGHVVIHLAAVTRGVQLPPHDRVVSPA